MLNIKYFEKKNKKENFFSVLMNTLYKTSGNFLQ